MTRRTRIPRSVWNGDAQTFVSLRDRAYETIKYRIITCFYGPGEVLSENAVASSLKIGRTPVHQAFDRLHVDGLVDVHPRSGIIVRPINLDEVIDIIEARLINESIAVRLAAERISSAEIVTLQNAVIRFEGDTAGRDVERLMLEDREFHKLISQATHNAVLATVLLRLHERSLRFWFLSLTAADHQKAVQTEHRRIFDAITRRDPDAAEMAMRLHIESFRQNVLRQSASSPGVDGIKKSSAVVGTRAGASL